MSGTSWSPSSLPEKSGKFLFVLDPALILKGMILTMGSSAQLNSVSSILHMLKLVYRFKLVYSI
jgi:hypothetical protein